jgi:glycosyltransferase involved in cell wall biosynthesis
MKICIFGKFPPIQGGVSMRTFWAAHGLAKLGHTVHVVTNAKETSAPYHMFMREEDWKRVEADYGSGSVKVYWTDLNARQQAHIPRGTPFVTKLASLGLELAQRQRIDVIFSHYAEPYGVAAHVTAQATGLPHVCRTAGSDAGRLWLLPQFRPLYDHMFQSASAVICGRAVAPKMIEAGVDPSRLARDHENVRLHDLFTPEGEALDVAVLRDQVLGSKDTSIRDLLFGKYDPSLTYFGVYGKLGLAKGTFALLKALKKLTDRGLPVGLLVMAHDGPMVQNTFRKFVADNGLQERVCQLPFLPHWRVPEFIRRCVAVCCLEQDFPIKFHTPVVAREVLTCGGCLVGSTEVIQKLPTAHKLIDGYNCIAVKDVNNIDDLEQRLASVLQSADRIAQVRQRARRYGVETEAGNSFPQRLEAILKDVAKGGQPSAGKGTAERRASGVSAQSNGQGTHRGNGKEVAVPPGRSRFAYLGMATRKLGLQGRLGALAALAKASPNPEALQLVRALKMDILMIEMRARLKQQGASDTKRQFGTFRLDHSHQLFDEAAFGEMVPGAREEYHVVELDFEPDLSEAHEPPLGNESDLTELPAPNGRRHYAVIPNDRADMICVVDDLDLAILQACDGSETVDRVCRDTNADSVLPIGTGDMRQRLVHLFEIGLIKLQYQDAEAELV